MGFRRRLGPVAIVFLAAAAAGAIGGASPGDRAYLLADLARRAGSTGLSLADPEASLAAEGPLHFLLLLAIERTGIDVVAAGRALLPLLLFAAGAAARALALDAGLSSGIATLAGVLVAADPVASGAAGTSGPAVSALVLAGALALGRGREVLGGAALGLALAARPALLVPVAALLFAEIAPRRQFAARAAALAAIAAAPAVVLAARHGPGTVFGMGLSSGPGIDAILFYGLVLLPFVALALVREISRRGPLLPALAFGLSGGLFVALLGDGGDPGGIAPASAALRVAAAGGISAFVALFSGAAQRLARVSALAAATLLVALEAIEPAAAFVRRLERRPGRPEELLPEVAGYLRREIPAEMEVAAFRVGALRAISRRDVVNLARGRLDRPRFFAAEAVADPWPTFDFLRPAIFVASGDRAAPDRAILRRAEFHRRYRLLRAFRGASDSAVYVFAHGAPASEAGDFSLVRPPEETGFPERSDARQASVDLVDDGTVALPSVGLVPRGGRRAKVGFFAFLRAEPILRFRLALRGPQGEAAFPGDGALAEVLVVSGSTIETIFSRHLVPGRDESFGPPVEIDLSRYAGTGIAISLESDPGLVRHDGREAVWFGDPWLARVDGDVLAADPPKDLANLVEPSVPGQPGAGAVVFDVLAAPRGPWEASAHVAGLESREGGLSFRSTGNDPFVTSPVLGLETVAIRFAEIGVKALRDDRRPDDILELTFVARPPSTRPAILRVPVIADGETHFYRVTLADSEGWSEAGAVTRIRVDPITAPGEIEISRLRLTRF